MGISTIEYIHKCVYIQMGISTIEYIYKWVYPQYLQMCIFIIVGASGNHLRAVIRRINISK